jgi:uncharacterized spore protein YtfJ
MKAQEIMSRVSDAMQVRRVFGEPYQKNGVTIIPVAAVRGGWGGGGGQGENQETGWGGGGGLTARPVGAFVITGDQVTWRPAVDVDRMILVGQIVGAIAVLTLGATLRTLIRCR